MPILLLVVITVFCSFLKPECAKRKYYFYKSVLNTLNRLKDTLLFKKKKNTVRLDEIT